MKKLLFFARAPLTAMLLCHAAASVCHAQDARGFLQQSSKAYGRWDDVKTLEYEVTGSREAGTQGKTYKSGERSHYTARRIYNMPRKQLYETNLNTFPGGYAFHFATIVQDTTAFNYDLDGTRGGKVYNRGGKATSESRNNVINNHIAYYKVKELLQSPDSLQLLQPDTGSYTIVKRLNAQYTPAADYYFSRKTKLLEKVTIVQAGQQIDMLFGNYSKKAGRVENRTVQVLLNGKRHTEEHINVKRVNFTFDSNLLQLPANYVANKSEAPSKPKEIAKDIFLIERLAGDRNVLFVNMDDYVTVIEAPISSDLSKQVIRLIREVVPHKPIKYVFTTHFHSDHTGGLRQYAHEGATLIMAAPTQAYVQDMLAAPQPDEFGKAGKTTATFQTIKGKYVLQDAHHLIEFYEVPNSHSDGMALAYFPNEQLIYQGDLLSVPPDGTLPFPIEVTKDLQKFLTAQDIPFTRMIGHHGLNTISPDMLQQVLQHRKPGTKNP